MTTRTVEKDKLVKRLLVELSSTPLPEYSREWLSDRGYQSLSEDEKEDLDRILALLELDPGHMPMLYRQLREMTEAELAVLQVFMFI